MGDSKERPRAGDPPRLDETVDILRELLVIERARLVVAIRIEDERKIVFPETTVIIRDIERLALEIEKRELSKPEVPPKKPQHKSGHTSCSLEDIDELLRLPTTHKPAPGARSQA